MSINSMYLFADDDASAARLDAIDQLHHSTAIYTASPVVADLLERVRWPQPGSKLADVSAGDGQFLTQALSKLIAAGLTSDEQILSCLEGYEIHHHACTQARARLAEILVDAGRDRASACELAEKIVHNKDFLTEGPTEARYSAVCGNPPFLRRLNIPALLRDEYDRHVPSFASADLLHAFIERVSNVLMPGGEMALVASDRWLASSGAAVLRERLGARFSIQHLERLDPKSVFYRPKKRKAGTPPRISPIAIHLANSAGGIPITKAPIYPGADVESYVGLPLLGEIATVELCPWLGPDGIFFIGADQVARSRIPEVELVRAFDTDDIIDGQLQEPTRFAILTSPNAAPSEAVSAHIRDRIHAMPAGARRASFYMPPETFWRMNLDQPSLFVPRIAKTPAAISVPSGYLPVNHNIRITCSCPERLEAIQRWLCTDLAARWLSDRAGRLENGFHLILTSLMRQMPVDLGI